MTTPAFICGFSFSFDAPKNHTITSNNKFLSRFHLSVVGRPNPSAFSGLTCPHRSCSWADSTRSWLAPSCASWWARMGPRSSQGSADSDREWPLGRDWTVPRPRCWTSRGDPDCTPCANSAPHPAWPWRRSIPTGSKWPEAQGRQGTCSEPLVRGAERMARSRNWARNTCSRRLANERRLAHPRLI